MIKVIKITKPECYKCFGASFGDCIDCDVKTQEVTLCMYCNHKDKRIMHREKLLCKKLHAWVEPCDFCSWGERSENEDC